MKSEMPELKIKEMGGVEGWEEFETWAKYNSLEWHRARSQARYVEASPLDEIKLILYFLTKSCEIYKDNLKNAATTTFVHHP